MEIVVSVAALCLAGFAVWTRQRDRREAGRNAGEAEAEAILAKAAGAETAALLVRPPARRHLHVVPDGHIPSRRRMPSAPRLLVLLAAAICLACLVVVGYPRVLTAPQHRYAVPPEPATPWPPGPPIGGAGSAPPVPHDGTPASRDSPRQPPAVEEEVAEPAEREAPEPTPAEPEQGRPAWAEVPQSEQEPEPTVDVPPLLRVWM